MAIDMVFFDFRDEEKEFFEKNKFPNFDFTFYKESLTPESVKNLPEEIKTRFETEKDAENKKLK